MRITHAMKPKHFESRALDLVEGISVAEQMRLARYLRLQALASGSDHGRFLEGLANEVESLIPDTKQKEAA